MSKIISEAFALRRVVRGEYQLLLEDMFNAADQATGGNLLNKEARARGVSSWSLFMGPERRAQKWASEELLDFWRSRPRVTYADYERARTEGF